MRAQMYDLETEGAADEIRRLNARRVLVQLPDGLRPGGLTLAKELGQLTGAEVILSGDSCYGACDLALTQADAVGADLIIHYGHSPMLQAPGTPVLYIEARGDFDAEALIAQARPHVKDWATIGLTATVQHVHKLEEVAECLRKAGHDALIGKAGGRVAHDGQILGCDYTTAQNIKDSVDGYLYIGAGVFHPIGLSIATGRPVVKANPYTMTAEPLDDRQVTRTAMKRMAAIEAAKGATRFAVIVSLKPGQLQLEAALAIQRRLEKAGKEATVIVLNEVGPIQLGNFTEAEAFVETACPRIALDGIADIKKPVLTPAEALVALGEMRWEELWGRNYFSVSHDHIVYNEEM